VVDDGLTSAGLLFPVIRFGGAPFWGFGMSLDFWDLSFPMAKSF